MSRAGPGRPRASSLETLVEAACELFLEKGFEETSIVDIAHRAGVSRSSFFNYASSKSGLLWRTFDARLERLPGALEDAAPAEALIAVFGDLAPDALALAFANDDAMGMAAELERESAVRLVRIAAEVSAALVRAGAGAGRMAADVSGAAHGGAVITALRHWALAGPGKQPLRVYLAGALHAVPRAGD